MAEKKMQLKTFRILAKVTIESWHDVKAASFEQAAVQAEALKASDFAESVGELYEASAPEISDIAIE